jgi:hypothetical protein
MQPKYNIYASILDSFQGYYDSDTLWENYYGGSENPSIAIDEFSEKKRLELIDKINRVSIPPEQTEVIDRGVCFEEIVNCLIEHRASKKMELISDGKAGIVTAKYNGRVFNYPLAKCMEFSRYFQGALPQVYCEGILPTKYGDVYLYGYIDMLLCDKIHDIKTTGGYEAWKYRNNWQHRVYPFCLDRMGNEISAFEYNILEIKSGKYTTYKEYYNYDKERVKGELATICELFIEFLEANREMIIDKKIFNN